MEAEQSVSQLSEELVAKEQELDVASQRADKVLQEVTAKAQAAEKVQRNTRHGERTEPFLVLPSERQNFTLHKSKELTQTPHVTL